jgi:hypothetical protein
MIVIPFVLKHTEKIPFVLKHTRINKTEARSPRVKFVVIFVVTRMKKSRYKNYSEFFELPGLTTLKIRGGFKW